MPSALLQAKYEGKNDEAERLARAAGEDALDLFEATALGRIHRVRALLDAEPALAQAVASDGFTALHLAAFFAQEGCAKLLLGRGADTNAVAANAMKVTPLHSAVAARQLGIVRALLDRGANPNARQAGGYTPMHGAAHNGDADTCNLLLARGADLDTKNDDGKSAMELARAAGHASLAADLAARAAS